MITIVTWLWKTEVYRSQYNASHVNAMYHQFQRFLKMPHRFLCVCEDPTGIECETHPIWEGPLADRVHHKKPNCYRRLLAFRPEIEDIFGERFVSVDIDAACVGELDPLFVPLVTGAVDFQIWAGGTHPTTPYNGSMWGMKAGARRQVWDNFDPKKSPDDAMRQNFYGSDQAIMALYLNNDEASWSQKDGVYGYRTDLRAKPHLLPNNARIVFFHGARKPWHEDVQERCPWLRKTGVTYEA